MRVMTSQYEISGKNHICSDKTFSCRGIMTYNVPAREKIHWNKPGGDSHMKQTGMLVVSLKGVNFGFRSRLGCSGQSANILSCQGLV